MNKLQHAVLSGSFAAAVLFGFGTVAVAAPADTQQSAADAIKVKVENQVPIKIGVVNMERILRDAKVAQIASDRLNAEGARRQEEIEAISRRFKQRLERFEKDAASMEEQERLQERRSLAEMERDVTRRTREAREEFNQRRNEEVLLLQNRAGRIIQDIARKEKFDLVLYEFFFASDRVDLTARVIEELDRGVEQDSKKTKKK